MTRIGIGIVAAGCAAALQAGQVSDDFVAAARAAYAKDEFCHESIVGKFAKAGVHDDKTPGGTFQEKVAYWAEKVARLTTAEIAAIRANLCGGKTADKAQP